MGMAMEYACMWTPVRTSHMGLLVMDPFHHDGHGHGHGVCMHVWGLACAQSHMHFL